MKRPKLQKKETAEKEAVKVPRRDQFYVRVLNWPDTHSTYYVCIDGFDVHCAGDNRAEAQRIVTRLNQVIAEEAQVRTPRPRRTTIVEPEEEAAPVGTTAGRPRLGGNKNKAEDEQKPKGGFAIAEAELKQARKAMRELIAKGASKAEVRAARIVVSGLRKQRDAARLGK